MRQLGFVCSTACAVVVFLALATNAQDDAGSECYEACYDQEEACYESCDAEDDAAACEQACAEDASACIEVCE